MPLGYQMNQVWYLRKDRPCSSPPPEADESCSRPSQAESDKSDHHDSEDERESWAPRPSPPADDDRHDGDSEQETWVPRLSQPEDDRYDSEDDVETVLGSRASVLSQPEDDSEPNDDAENEQRPLRARLSELELTEGGHDQGDESEQEPLSPNLSQSEGNESGGDETDESLRKALLIFSVKSALKNTKSSLTVEEALGPGGPLSEDSRRRRLGVVYPEGFHIRMVHVGSLIHTCVGCSLSIRRGKFLVHKYVSKDRTTQIVFYHLKGSCLDALSPEDQEEVRDQFQW